MIVILTHNAKTDGVILIYPDKLNRWRSKQLKSKVRETELII